MMKGELRKAILLFLFLIVFSELLKRCFILLKSRIILLKSRFVLPKSRNNLPDFYRRSFESLFNISSQRRKIRKRDSTNLTYWCWFFISSFRQSVVCCLLSVVRCQVKKDSCKFAWYVEKKRENFVGLWKFYIFAFSLLTFKKDSKNE